MAGEATTSTTGNSGDAPAEPPGGASNTEETAATTGTVAPANQPDWATIEADLESEVDASPNAESDSESSTSTCGPGVTAALGVLVATSDTYEFVGNANVELTLKTDEAAGGGEGAAGTNAMSQTQADEGDREAGGTAAGGTKGGATAEDTQRRKTPDKTGTTKADNGSAIWKPFAPAGEYYINVPVLPENYQDKYFPTPDDEYRVTVANSGTATKIVFIHPKPWIEIKLLDSLGEPAKGHAYRLELPVPEGAEEGTQPVVLKEGTLDDDGFARVTGDDVIPGTELAECNVIFPTQVSQEGTEAVVTPQDWIRIELLDALGQPARYWRYEIYAEGSESEAPDYVGTLDAVGIAFVTVDARLDQCEIKFLPPLERVEVAEPQQSGNWVRIEMLDGLGNPAAHWRYEIAIADRASRYTGTLDAIGQAIVPVFVGEECEIEFKPPLG